MSSKKVSPENQAEMADAKNPPAAEEFGAGALPAVQVLIRLGLPNIQLILQRLLLGYNRCFQLNLGSGAEFLCRGRILCVGHFGLVFGGDFLR